MGVFFYTHSVALIEDIGLEEEYKTEADLIRDMDTGYEQVLIFFYFSQPGVLFIRGRNREKDQILRLLTFNCKLN